MRYTPQLVAAAPLGAAVRQALRALFRDKLPIPDALASCEKDAVLEWQALIGFSFATWVLIRVLLSLGISCHASTCCIAGMCDAAPCLCYRTMSWIQLCVFYLDLLGE